MAIATMPCSIEGGLGPDDAKGSEELLGRRALVAELKRVVAFVILDSRRHLGDLLHGLLAIYVQQDLFDAGVGGVVAH